MKAKRSLTPGAVDHAATREAVCVSGYATARRPTLWQALKLKKQAMKLYGLALTPRGWHSHTLDHLVPLELGGAPLTLDNVWPQTKANAKVKDRDENLMKRKVCAGTTTLAQAQQFFVNHWSV